MTTTKFLTEAKKLELIQYQNSPDRNQLVKTHIAFSGSLRQHPYDSDKVILLSEPYSSNTTFYEFMREHIGCVEKLPNIVNSDGNDVTMVMLWVKKGSIGIRSAAFIVDNAGL
jgi:hypothetical protein